MLNQLVEGMEVKLPDNTTAKIVKEGDTVYLERLESGVKIELTKEVLNMLTQAMGNVPDFKYSAKAK